MVLNHIILCALVSMTSASSSGTGEMLSMCAVEGTQVEFHCTGATIWYIGHHPYNDEMDTLTLNATMDTENSSASGSGVEYITCIQGDDYIDASLVTVEESDTRVPLILTAAPETKTSLLLEWEDPFRIGNTTYEVVVTVGQERMTWTTNVSSWEVGLEGSDCQPFQVSVSMPGTCTPATLNGSLLLDPPYPKPENVLIEVLKNKSLILTWEQPEDIFEEDNFTYVIMVFDGDTMVKERLVTLEASVSPREEFNLTEVEDCGEVMLTLVQLGDCREEIVTTTIPIFPGGFLSELEAEVLFLSGGELELVELKFKPPALCEYQIESAGYLLTISDGARSWSVVGPLAVSSEVVFSDRGHHFARDQEYTVTATVMTRQGNISSTTIFSTLSLLAEAQLDENSLVLSVSNDSVSLIISWGNPTNTLSSYFAYVIKNVLVDTGEGVGNDIIVVPEDDTPVVEFRMDEKVCKKVNVSVQIFNSDEIISNLITIPARPKAFQKNVTAYTFMIDGKIKELEVAFTPPRLCVFQRASYVLSFTSGNETWSRDPVTISDTQREVKEDIETGFVRNRNYTLTVTIVIPDYDNITSSDDFIFFYEDDVYPSTDNSDHTHSPNIQPTATNPTATPTTRSLPPEIAHLEPRRESMSPVVMGTAAAGIGLLAAVCVCFAFGVGVCYLRARRKRRQGKTPRPNVRNPIYETSGDDVYEELPDLLRDKQHEEATYCDVAPPLPSARYDHLPPAPAKLQDHKGEGANGVSINQPSKQNDPSENKKENQLALPSSSSSGALSVGSSEDCYTVMNTAGTVTVMPRSRASGLGTQWGASPSGE